MKYYEPLTDSALVGSYFHFFQLNDAFSRLNQKCTHVAHWRWGPIITRLANESELSTASRHRPFRRFPVLTPSNGAADRSTERGVGSSHHANGATNSRNQVILLAQSPASFFSIGYLLDVLKVILKT